MNSLSDILSSNMDDYQPQTASPSTQQTPLSYDDEYNHAETQQHHPSRQTLDTEQLKRMIFSMKDQLDSMLRVIDGNYSPTSASLADTVETQTGEKIIEGVFTGEKMLGADGKEYSVPPNYASKSKLVEGDMMKLTITTNGSFIYKQIGPIERKRVVGILMCDPDTHQWSVMAEGRSYKILNASISFYKGSAGDEAVILVPESGESQWGAVENVIQG